MALNYLNFNDSKTKVIMIEPSGASHAPLDLGSFRPYVKVTNLGVKVDSDFRTDEQMNSVVKSSLIFLLMTLSWFYILLPQLAYYFRLRLLQCTLCWC